MNCEFIADHMAKIVYAKLPRGVMGECRKHLYECPECTDAVRGAEALALLRNCGSESVPDGLFDKLSSALQEPATVEEPTRPRFWLGTGLGGAVAASLFVVAMTVGWIGPSTVEPTDMGQFAVSVYEPTMMDVAIEADRPLANASISILLSGDVEIEGYRGQRELTWVTDLEQGVNRLNLPVVALDESGGKMVVRLDHPQSEQVFVVKVDASA